jgi:hydroxymethylpyrimidine/phosphomethylpyrimidine kinase
MVPIALTIAGSDPSGGAGIQADLKTFHQFGVYGEAVITLLTVQNTQTVDRIEVMSADLVRDQLVAVLNDIPPDCVKTGALGSPEIVRLIADLSRQFRLKLIVDPVMISKHGSPLLSEAAQKTMIEHLLPHAYLVTPNIPEAAAISGLPATGTTAREYAEKLLQLGVQRVLVKGGHGKGNATDLYAASDGFQEFSAPRIDTANTHGTGCTLSAAIAAELAKGAEICDAIARAKRFVTEAIRTNPSLGRGVGPLNHHARS